jgi:hypothetical protein
MRTFSAQAIAAPAQVRLVRVVSVQAERSECPETDTGRSCRLRLHRIGMVDLSISAMLKIPASSKHKLRKEMRSSSKQAASRDIHQGLSWRSERVPPD